MTKIKTFYANATPETPEAYAVRIALNKLPGELRIQFFNWLGSDKINRDISLMQQKIKQLKEQKEKCSKHSK